MNRREMSKLLSGLAAIGSPLVFTNLHAAEGPAIIQLGQRTGSGAGAREGNAYSHIPSLDVGNSKPETLSVSMFGVAAAGGNIHGQSMAEMTVEVSQNFRISGAERVKMSLDSHLVGQLWCNRKGEGVASLATATVTVTDGKSQILGVDYNGRSQTGTDILTIDDKLEPTSRVVEPGEYFLIKRLSISCSHPKACFHRNVAMAFFGTEGPKPPDWLALYGANRDAPKQKNLGFKSTLKVANI